MITPRPSLKSPLKSQYKPLCDITLDELAFIASPVFAQSKFHDKTQRIDGIPAALQPQQIENAEWVLLCQDGAKHSPAFSYNKPLQRWDVHTRINGVTRTAMQSHLNTLQQRWMKPSSTGSSATAASEYVSVSAPPPAFDATSAASPTPTDVSTAAASAQGPTEQKCTLAGEPISMTRGEELLSLDDVALLGPVPFIWKRTYRTSNSRDIGLGHGWVHPGQATLTLTDTTIELIADDGRTISFARPVLGRKSRQLHEGFILEFATPQQILIAQRGQPTHVFTRVNDNLFRVTQWRHKAYIPAKQRIGVPVPATGYALNFHYDSVGRLQRVQGNWGRSLEIERNDNGRIAAIHHINSAGAKRDTPAIRYTYDAAGDLIATHNAAGHGEQYCYSNHILLQRTLATGYAFYFEWDQLTPAAKCLKQWGDNGHYAYAFTWDEKNQFDHASWRRWTVGNVR